MKKLSHRQIPVNTYYNKWYHMLLYHITTTGKQSPSTNTRKTWLKTAMQMSRLFVILKWSQRFRGWELFQKIEKYPIGHWQRESQHQWKIGYGCCMPQSGHEKYYCVFYDGRIKWQRILVHVDMPKPDKMLKMPTFMIILHHKRTKTLSFIS